MYVYFTLYLTGLTCDFLNLGKNPFLAYSNVLGEGGLR